MPSDDDRNHGGADYYPLVDGNVADNAGRRKTSGYLPETDGNSPRTRRRYSDDTTRPPQDDGNRRYLERNNIRTSRHHLDNDSIGNRISNYEGNPAYRERQSTRRSEPYNGSHNRGEHRNSGRGYDNTRGYNDNAGNRGHRSGGRDYNTQGYDNTRGYSNNAGNRGHRSSGRDYNTQGYDNTRGYSNSAGNRGHRSSGRGYNTQGYDNARGGYNNSIGGRRHSENRFNSGAENRTWSHRDGSSNGDHESLDRTRPNYSDRTNFRSGQDNHPHQHRQRQQDGNLGGHYYSSRNQTSSWRAESSEQRRHHIEPSRAVRTGSYHTDRTSSSRVAHSRMISGLAATNASVSTRGGSALENNASTGEPRATLPVSRLLAEITCLGSRRKIGEMLETGKILVNGQHMNAGDHILRAEIKQVEMAGNNIPITADPGKEPVLRVLMYHKGLNELCSRFDIRGRKLIFRNLAPIHGRWISVGRLDYMTSGLLLCTNNGELAQRLMHPSFEIPREYRAQVLGELNAKSEKLLLSGIDIGDGISKFDELKICGHEETQSGIKTTIEVVLHSGRNREVRRLLDEVGLHVIELHRTRFGDFCLPEDSTPENTHELSIEEKNKLLQSVGMDIIK